MLTLAYRLSRDVEEAKEIAQETLLRAFRYLHSYDRKRSFKNWLLQIEINVWRQTRKRRPDELFFRDLAGEAGAENPAGTGPQVEIKEKVLACLEELTPREKEVFLLRDIEEVSVKETARLLNSSSISVRVHLSSARQKIRQKIKQKFPQLLERWT
jgi:RNA polymerase sigma-70 factor (ECF subfamily)